MHLYLKWNKSATAVCVGNLVQLYIEFVSNIQGSRTTGLYLLSMLQLAIASGHPADFFFFKKGNRKKKKKDIFVIFKFCPEILFFPPFIGLAILWQYVNANSTSKWIFLFFFNKFELKTFICTNQWLFLCFKRTLELSLAPNFVLMEAVYNFNANPEDRPCWVGWGEESDTGKGEGEGLWIHSTELYLSYGFLIFQWQNKDSYLLS